MSLTQTLQLQEVVALIDLPTPAGSESVKRIRMRRLRLPPLQLSTNSVELARKVERRTTIPTMDSPPSSASYGSENS